MFCAGPSSPACATVRKALVERFLEYMLKLLRWIYLVLMNLKPTIMIYLCKAKACLSVSNALFSSGDAKAPDQLAAYQDSCAAWSSARVMPVIIVSKAIPRAQCGFAGRRKSQCGPHCLVGTLMVVSEVVKSLVRESVHWRLDMMSRKELQVVELIGISHLLWVLKGIDTLLRLASSDIRPLVPMCLNV